MLERVQLRTYANGCQSRTLARAIEKGIRRSIEKLRLHSQFRVNDGFKLAEEINLLKLNEEAHSAIHSNAALIAGMNASSG